MIETLISSKTRIKLLLKFFLNSSTKAYLRGLESEFGESSNAIRLELNKLEKAGMLSTFLQGNKKFFQANKEHPLFKDIHNILLKHVGFDRIIESVIERLGDVDRVYVIGEFSNGRNCDIVDLLFIGNIDKNYLLNLVDKAEKLINRKIRYLIYSPLEALSIKWESYSPEPYLLWEQDLLTRNI